MARRMVPVYLGTDALSIPETPPVGMAEVDDRGDITVLIEGHRLEAQAEKLTDIGQLRAFTINIAYVRTTETKEND